MKKTKNNKPKKVIMISGLARSGKDYIADKLCVSLGIKKYAFADTIKEILSKTFNISIEELDKMKNDEEFIIHTNGKKQTYRNIYQFFGTEAMQSVFGKYVWVNKLFEKVKNEDFFIISDLRFIHEYERIVKIYGKENVFTVNVISKNTKKMNHKSEKNMKGFDFDYVFDNTEKNNPEETEKKIKLLIKYIKTKG